MEKVVWDTIIVPVVRQHLTEKYVPTEPIDPLVYKITAFYWLLQELIGNWKVGKRLAFDQKVQLLQLIVWNLPSLAREQAAYDESTEYKIRRQGFDIPRESIPPPVEEEYDITLSHETIEQITQLVLACKEFHLKE
jgi:hypothetical protein